jgi:hypothetical protein
MGSAIALCSVFCFLIHYNFARHPLFKGILIMRSLLRRCALCLVCLLSFAPLHAAPAPYYLWMNLLDGSRVCSQLSLGQGWKKMGGPYKDARCQKPVNGNQAFSLGTRSVTAQNSS